MVFQVLNKLKWTGQLHEAEIIILHRGPLENRKTIPGKSISEVKKSYFLYHVQGKEMFIPLHRVQRIVLNQKTLWER